MQAVKQLAARADLSLPQFALAWVLRQPNVASAITGASRPEQVDENAAASDARSTRRCSARPKASWPCAKRTPPAHGRSNGAPDVRPGGNASGALNWSMDGIRAR